MFIDFQVFETYMASQRFMELPDAEKEEYLASYRQFLLEESNEKLREAKMYLYHKNLAEMFFKIYGSADKTFLREKDDQWFETFGIRPTSFYPATLYY